MTVACLIATAAIFRRIHALDVRRRVVARAHLAALVVLRLGLLAATGIEALPASEATRAWWGAEALAVSAGYGVLVAVGIALLGRIVSCGAGREAIGAGDVKLYAVCCLFLDGEGVILFMAASSLVGAACALHAAAQRARDFPFAPAIVWACWAVLAARTIGDGALV